MTEQTYRPIPLFLATALLAVAAFGCNLLNQSGPPTAAVTATSPYGAPTVVINSPTNGSEVVLGQELLVLATAQDVIGVTRVELRANGFIVNTVSSESPSGNQQFSVIQAWVPSQVGTVTLEVIAYRATIASTPAQVVVNVRGSSAQVTATMAPPVGITPIVTDDPTCRTRIEVNGLNFRTGPGTNYPIIRVMTLGEVAPITGRLGDNSWWQIRDQSFNVGWISSSYTTESGNCSMIPVVAPPPSPTPRPATATPTLTATVPGPASLTPIPVPDLVVSAIDGPTFLQLNSTGTVGAHYVVRVANQGTGDSGQFTTSFRNPDGTIQVLPIVVNLAPGQSAELPVDVLFAGANTFELMAVVDSGSQVAESDEGNNIRTISVLVTNIPLLVTLPGPILPPLLPPLIDP